MSELVEERRGRGAPALPFDQRVADEFCDAVAANQVSLPKLCEDNPHWPSLSTIYKWLRTNAEFEQAYARAKQQKADYLADEIIDIVDDKSLSPHDKRIRFEGRKWAAAKLNPRRYGDSIDVTSKGEALAAPVLNQVAIDQRVQTILLLAAQRRQDEEEARRLME